MRLEYKTVVWTGGKKLEGIYRWYLMSQGWMRPRGKAESQKRRTPKIEPWALHHLLVHLSGTSKRA